LTLEDSAKLAPLEEAAEDQDVLVTDLEVGALAEDSDSQVAQLDDADTDVESSDFDLAISDEDMVPEEESGSQVVALEDEADADEGASTVAKPSKSKAKGKASRQGLMGDAEGAEDSAVAVADEDEAFETEDLPVRGKGGYAPAAAADWGTLVPVSLFVSLFLLFMGFLASFELVRGLVGYRQPNAVSSPLLKAVNGMIGDPLPD